MSFVHRYISVAGFKTHYLEAGDGPVVVLLHGGEYGAAAEITWEHCIEELATQYRVIAPDFYGYGLSDKVRDFRSHRRRLVEQISTLLETLCITSASFVGTSLSGRLVLDAARRNPMSWPVEAIVAVGVGLHPPGGEALRALETYDGSLDGLRPIMPLLFADPAFAEDETYLRRRHDFCTIAGAWEFGAANRIRRPVEGPARQSSVPPPSYRGISTPTLLMLGEHDQLVPRPSWQQLAKDVPNARTHVIEGAGHYPQIERPTEFVSHLMEFLSSSRTQHG